MSAPNNKKLTYKEKSGLAFVAQEDPPFIKAMKAKMGFKEPAKLEDKYADEDTADFDDPETELMRMKEEERPQVVVLNPETDLSQNELTKALEVIRKEEDEKKIAEDKITFKKLVKRNLEDAKELEEAMEYRIRPKYLDDKKNIVWNIIRDSLAKSLDRISNQPSTSNEAGHVAAKVNLKLGPWYKEQPIVDVMSPSRTPQAWEIYCQIFKRISGQIRQLTSLDLNDISLKLKKARDLELAVPGRYDPNSPVIGIASVGTHLQVIQSKQRPRKMSIRGSNGLEYVFMLKGHEDPRQDERVIQFFGLINTLLVNNAETCRRNLTIQRYSITALSQNSGLNGWVPNCDKIHSMIRDYREKKRSGKSSLSTEHKTMQLFAPDSEQLTLIQKLQVFDCILNTSEGDDLWEIMCMSMVGYILGLGDSHPSNLMLDRLTGKIIHIDFGDCFDVAMTREQFPDKAMVVKKRPVQQQEASDTGLKHTSIGYKDIFRTPIRMCSKFILLFLAVIFFPGSLAADTEPDIQEQASVEKLKEPRGELYCCSDKKCQSEVSHACIGYYTYICFVSFLAFCLWATIEFSLCRTQLTTEERKRRRTDALKKYGKIYLGFLYVIPIIVIGLYTISRSYNYLCLGMSLLAAQKCSVLLPPIIYNYTVKTFTFPGIRSVVQESIIALAALGLFLLSTYSIDILYIMVVVLNPETDLSQNELTKALEVIRKEEDEKKIADGKITFKKPVKRNLEDAKEVEEKKRKERDASPKPQKNLLSFGDDEEDE